MYTHMSTMFVCVYIVYLDMPLDAYLMMIYTLVMHVCVCIRSHYRKCLYVDLHPVMWICITVCILNECFTYNSTRYVHISDLPV